MVVVIRLASVVENSRVYFPKLTGFIDKSIIHHWHSCAFLYLNGDVELVFRTFQVSYCQFIFNHTSCNSITVLIDVGRVK